MSIREQVAAADDTERELVDVPEWGVKIELCSPAVQDRTRLVAKFLRGDGTLDWVALFPELLVITCHDPDTGERAFDESDVEMLLTKNATVVDRLAEIASHLAGLDAEILRPPTTSEITDDAIAQGKDD